MGETAMGEADKAVELLVQLVLFVCGLGSGDERRKEEEAIRKARSLTIFWRKCEGKLLDDGHLLLSRGCLAGDGVSEKRALSDA